MSNKIFSAREIREKLGLTQLEMADKLGISRMYVSQIERDCVKPSKKIKAKLIELNTEISKINKKSIIEEFDNAVEVDGSVKDGERVPMPFWASKLNDAIADERKRLAHIEQLLIQILSRGSGHDL